MKKLHALVSVSDKSGVASFCKGLSDLGFTIISTGRTADLLVQNGILCVPVSAFTGVGEIFSGRVKTLHMKVCAGVLYDPSSAVHKKEAEHYGIEHISLVAINFYPVPSDMEDSEQIDIGGPTLLRAAAKNYRHVTAVCSPDDYDLVITRLQRNELDENYRRQLAEKVFFYTASYDARICTGLAQKKNTGDESSFFLPEKLPLFLQRQKSLRYGENPHQVAGVYVPVETDRFACADLQQLQGKDLSYNNLLDLSAGVRLLQEFNENTVAIIKHNNPCGVASGSGTAELFKLAKECDAKSAFGGVIVLNFTCDADVAVEIAADFFEGVIAPQFTADSLQVFAQRKNLRIISVPWLSSVFQEYEVRSLPGAYLIQSLSRGGFNKDNWRIVTTKTPSPDMYTDFLFASQVVKHVKSNAIVVAKNKRVLAIGAGQMSRIDSLLLAFGKARELDRNLADSVLASDGFFPFDDWVEPAAKQGVAAVIQPGGSVRDAASIASCNRYGISMVFTNARSFSH